MSRYGLVALLTAASAGATFEAWTGHFSAAAETMDPDLAITIAFVGEVILFALVFALYVLHEAAKAHVDSARDPRPRNRQSGTSDATGVTAGSSAKWPAPQSTLHDGTWGNPREAP